MNKPTICRECRWLFLTVTAGEVGQCLCAHPKAPVTDFVLGRHQCEMINQGDCPFHQAKESIPPNLNN